MHTKRILLVLAISALGAFMTTGLFAACGTATPAANVNGWQPTVGGGSGLGTTVLCHFWQYGTPANNSGTMAQSLMATAYSTGYYVTTNWANSGVVGCPGILSALGGTRTTFVYSIANGGTGQYLPMTTTWSASLSRYDFDAISNGPGNTPTPLAIPKPAVTLSSQDASYYYFTVTWPAISNLKGYYDSAPANNIITGLVLRTATSTASYATSNWTVGTLSDGSSAVINFGASGTDSGAIPGGLTLRLAKPINTGTYLAISLLFDGASPGDAIRETSFVGAPLSVIGPTASPLFANVTADPTRVAWTSGDESRVASYQAYMSLTPNGTYRAIGQPVAALGSGHSYTVNYRVVAPTYYVKIKASKTDGTFVWSSAVKVTRIAPEPRPLPGKAGLRK
jgi:hypothetical protein